MKIKMFVCSKSTLKIMIILHVSGFAYSGGTGESCSDNIRIVQSKLNSPNNGQPNTGYPKTVNDMNDDSEEKGYGNSGCAQSQDNNLRERYIFGLNCVSGSQLSYVAQNVDQISTYPCNAFNSGQGNETYYVILGQYCYTLNVQAQYEYTHYQGKEVYVEAGSLDGTPCAGGYFIQTDDLSVNQRGSCQSKEGLKQIESSYATFSVFGGPCQSLCFGKLIENLCPGAH